jgi:hypothetical protein
MFAAKVTHQAPAGGERRLAIIDYLAAHGYLHAPRLLRTRAGATVHQRGDTSITLLEFVPSLSEEPSDVVAMWGDLASAAAVLNALHDFDVEFAIPVRQAIAEVAEHASSAEFGSTLMGLVPRAASVTGSPRGLIHGEINPSNARRRADGTVVLVDWDDAGIGPTALEVGYPLITSFIAVDTHRVDADSARAWFHGYCAAGGRVDPPQVFNAALFHALRYMWFADVEARWERILYAVKNEAELVDLMR